MGIKSSGKYRRKKNLVQRGKKRSYTSNNGTTGRMKIKKRSGKKK